MRRAAADMRRSVLASRGKSVSLWQNVALLLLWALAAGVACGEWTALGYDEATQSYFPTLRPPRSLVVAKTWDNGQERPLVLDANSRAAQAELILLQSLSGLLLKQGSTEGLFLEANASYRLILNDLSRRRGIPFAYFSGPLTAWDLVARFQGRFAGRYVLSNIEANPDSLNVARMAAYRFNALIVDAAVRSKAEAREWTRVFDASDKTDAWYATNWWPTWPRQGIGLEQNNNPALAGDYSCLNDYTPATGVPTFFDGADTPLRRSFLQGLGPDAVLIGWPHFDELSFTSANSQQNVSLAAANWSLNLALLSSLHDPNRLPLKQPLCARSYTPATNAHYVTFVFTDGDNVQWFHNAFLQHTQWWGSPVRGQIPLGWGLPPTLRDLSPTIAEYLLENAAGQHRPAQDAFVAMSPVGYCYPSMFSAAARATNAVRLARYMRDLDLQTLVLLDNAGFEKPSIYQPYLQQPQIQAIFYWDAFGNYAKYAGAIHWQHGKPIISAFTNLWGDTGPAQVAAALNGRPRDSRLPSGYSLVDVHAWTRGVADVAECMRQLHSQVRVVTPDVFVSLLQRQVGPPPVCIDLGNSQLAPYGPPTPPAMSVAPNQTDRSVDGSPSTRVTLGGAYAFSNMEFPAAISVDPSLTALEFDLWGNNSGSVVRLELWSDAFAAFFFVDVVLDFTGWRHFAFRLNCSDGLRVWNATPQQVASALNIWQVSGSWNGTPGVCYLDNVKLTWVQPAPARPRLSFKPVGQQSLLSWSADFSDFTLQCSKDVVGPWLPSSAPIENLDCQCSVLLTGTLPRQFYRLSSP
jgi:hypothetical protein